MKTNYEKHIQSLTNKYRTNKKLSRGQSDAIRLNDCPFCEFSSYCGEFTIDQTSKYIKCVARSSDTQDVWIMAPSEVSKISVGDVFSYLTIIKVSEKNKHGQSMWLCKCECGNETIVRSDNLLNGNTKSCGCQNGKTLSKKCPYISKERRYKVGSLRNPDRTKHSWATEHYSKVDCKIDQEIKVRDKDDPSKINVIIKTMECDECAKKGIKSIIRYDDYNDKVCPVCGLTY